MYSHVGKLMCASDFQTIIQTHGNNSSAKYSMPFKSHSEPTPAH
jgi:hypothetical protein